MNHRRPDSRPLTAVFLLLLVAAFASGALLERVGVLPGGLDRAPAGLGDTFKPFWETWNLVERKYVDQKAVDPTKMTRGAIDGMLAALGDVGHTGYLTPEEVEVMEQSMAGKFEGIGARMTVRKKQPAIAETFPGSPARKAGLKPGDVLLEVDGKPVAGMPVDKVARIVRGPAGTDVKIRVARGNGATKVLDFNIKRGKVDIPVVSWAMLPGTDLAHIALREFGAKADAQIRAAIEQAKAKGAKGIVLDIRGNPGGLKDQAVAVTSEFLEGDKVVFIEQDAEGERKKIEAKPGGIASDIPLVVLIDQGSASSAEILAGALQDYGRAKLVGTKTFGTGTVLLPYRLSDGSAVLLAVAQWYTPEGRQIWHKGIAPDLEVEQPKVEDVIFPNDSEGLTAEGLSKDRQLHKGLEVLREQIQGKKAA